MSMLSRLIIIIAIFALTTAYQCSKKSKMMQEVPRQLVVDKTFDYSANLSAYEIKEAVLKDSILVITFIADVCQEDVVDLVFNGSYLKSMPPKAQLGLRFKENLTCKKNTITKSYIVSSVRYLGKPTILLLPGYDPITY